MADSSPACPECSSTRTDLVQSRRTNNGGRRRRHRCLACGHRWTTYEGERPTRQPRHHLLPEQVRLILLSTDSDSALARRFKRSRPAIASLRTGRTYVDLWPELPRRSPSRSCRDCQHRRTTYEGERPDRKLRSQLPPEQVRQILLSTDSDNDLARRFKRSHTAIANLRTGRSYADLWPELPRRSPPRSCHDCQQWLHGRCSLGFPDPELEGPGFAADCECFSTAPLP